MVESPIYHVSNLAEYYIVAIACIAEPTNAKEREILIAGARSFSERREQGAYIDGTFDFSFDDSVISSWHRDNLLNDKHHSAFIHAANKLTQGGRNLARISIMVQNMIVAFQSSAPIGRKKAASPLITRNAERDAGQQNGSPLSATSARNLWANYKDVAHLVTAFVICFMKDFSPEDESRNDNIELFQNFKDISEGIRRDLITSIPPNTKFPNLNPETTIKIVLE
jgi:hypothetical protein